MTTTPTEASAPVNFMRLKDGPIVPVTDEAFRLVWEPRGHTAVSDQDASDAANAPDEATAVAESAPPAVAPQTPAGRQQPGVITTGGQQTPTP